MAGSVRNFAASSHAWMLMESFWPLVVVGGRSRGNDDSGAAPVVCRSAPWRDVKNAAATAAANDVNTPVSHCSCHAAHHRGRKAKRNNYHVNSFEPMSVLFIGAFLWARNLVITRSEIRDSEIAARRHFVYKWWAWFEPQQINHTPRLITVNITHFNT